MSPHRIHQLLQRTSHWGAFNGPCRAVLRTTLPHTLERGEREALMRLMGWLLGEPRHVCRTILQEFLYHRAVSAKRWADVMARRVTTAAVIERVALGDDETLRHYLQARAPGVVVTTFHAGDYLSALLKLASLLPAGRCIYVLRRAGGRGREDNESLPKLLPGARVVLDDGHGLRTGVRALRAGHLLAVLCDLPRPWGATTPVSLFGRTLAWTRSAADFALLGRADLLPLTSHLEPDGTCVANPGRVIPAGSVVPRSAMHSLGRLAQQQIRRFPGQWHQWPLLPDMLDHAGEARND